MINYIYNIWKSLWNPTIPYLFQASLKTLNLCFFELNMLDIKKFSEENKKLFEGLLISNVSLSHTFAELYRDLIVEIDFKIKDGITCCRYDELYDRELAIDCVNNYLTTFLYFSRRLSDQINNTPNIGIGFSRSFRSFNTLVTNFLNSLNKFFKKSYKIESFDKNNSFFDKNIRKSLKLFEGTGNLTTLKSDTQGLLIEINKMMGVSAKFICEFNGSSNTVGLINDGNKIFLRESRFEGIYPIILELDQRIKNFDEKSKDRVEGVVLDEISNKEKSKDRVELVVLNEISNDVNSNSNHINEVEENIDLIYTKNFEFFTFELEP